MKYENLLASRYIKAQKRQSVFTVVSIAAAVAVMAMFFLLYSVYLNCIGVESYHNEPYHLNIAGITKQQGEIIQNEPHVGSVKLIPKSNGEYFAYVMFEDDFGSRPEWIQSVEHDIGTQYLSDRCQWNEKLMFLDYIGDTAHLKHLQGFCVVFILVLFIAFALRLIIDTAFEVSSKERERHYGVLQSIGATPQQIVKIITSEALKLCAFGIPLGLIAGIAFAYGMFMAVMHNGFEYRFKEMTDSGYDLWELFSVDPLMLLAAAVTGVVWVFLSSYGVGMRIIRKSPMEAITVRENTVKKVKKHSISGLLFGISGSMASRNARRQKKRFIITILTLTVSISIFGIFTTATNYVGEGIENFYLAETMGGDFLLDIMPDKTELVENSGLFKDISIYATRSFRFTDASEDNDKLYAEYVNKEGYEKLFGDNAPVSYEELAASGGYIVNLSRSEFIDPELLKNDTIRVNAPRFILPDKEKKYDSLKEMYMDAEKVSDEEEWRIMGSAETDYSMKMIHGTLIGTMETFNDLNDDVLSRREIECVCSLINRNGYEDAETFFAVNYKDITVEEDAFGDITTMQNTLSAIKSGIVFINVLMGIIALINLMNIVSTGIANRRSEFASLQCLGMTRGQLICMTAIECMQFTLTAVFISALFCTLILIGLATLPKIIFSVQMVSEQEAEMIKKLIPDMNYVSSYIRIAAAALAAYLTAFAASVVMLKRQNEDSLTDQIRGAEMHISNKKSHIIRNSVIVVVGALVLVFAGLRIYSVTSYNSDKKAYEESGYLNLVESNGFKMNVYITGAENGKHTIVGLAGQGLECFPITAKAMTEILGQENKVVFPDRAGNGFSEDTKTPQTVEQVVEDYRTGLKNAGVEAPYVLMGHSYGGVYATYWQLKYPKEVESVVFLDSYYIPDSDLWQMYESEDPTRLSHFKKVIFKRRFGLDRLSAENDDDPTGRALFSDEDMKLINMMQANVDIGTKAYASECLLLKEEDHKMNDILVSTEIPKLFIAATPTCEEDLREFYEFMKADYEAAGKQFGFDPVETARSVWNMDSWYYQDEYLNTLAPFMERLGNCKCKSISGEHAFFYAQKPQQVADAITEFLDGGEK